ncbi:MAG: TetR family transcriptional regulator [Bryobacterales bacterium]|nr:TetR family transcriptional regulator [Bryobacterales bacterium]
MKRKPLTRRESREVTRERLIAAAEKAFIRRGFAASSVEQIAESAGFSRGAFYSNFRNKEELFIEVLKVKRREIDGALEEIVRRETGPAARLRAVLDWYVNQDFNKGWAILKSEFTLHALRNRAARSRIAEFNRQRLEHYSSLLARYFADSGVTSPGRPDVIALILFGAASGLNDLALLEPDAERRKRYTECLDLVFTQMLPPYL